VDDGDHGLVSELGTEQIARGTKVALDTQVPLTTKHIRSFTHLLTYPIPTAEYHSSTP
jgi:hypothetical protein